MHPLRDASDPVNGDTGAGRAALGMLPPRHPQNAAHRCGVSSRSPQGRRLSLAREGSPGSQLPPRERARAALRGARLGRRGKMLIIGLGRRGAQSLPPAQPPAASGHHSPGGCSWSGTTWAGLPLCPHSPRGQIPSPLGQCQRMGPAEPLVAQEHRTSSQIPACSLPRARPTPTWHSPHVIQDLAFPL